jgi:hypothetical protein
MRPNWQLTWQAKATQKTAEIGPVVAVVGLALVKLGQKMMEKR